MARYGLEAAEATAAVESASEAEAAVEKECAGEVRCSKDCAGKAQRRFPLAPCAGAWTRLRQLLRCAEPYCQPSNSGQWSSMIGYLLQALCQFTSCRVLMESSGLSANAAHNLEPGDISVLVRMLHPLAACSLYSKGGQLMRMAQTSCRYLCSLAPELALSSTMHKLCEGLQAVTAIHQTPMALSTLALLAAELADLTTAPCHVLCEKPAPASAAARIALASAPRVLREAMELALPGIDPNDIDKLAGSLRFFEQVFLAVRRQTLHTAVLGEVDARDRHFFDRCPSPAPVSHRSTTSPPHPLGSRARPPRPLESMAHTSTRTSTQSGYTSVARRWRGSQPRAAAATARAAATWPGSRGLWSSWRRWRSRRRRRRPCAPGYPTSRRSF